TYKLTAPANVKKLAQLVLRRPQTVSDSVTWPPINFLIKFRLNTEALKIRITANNQYSTVGFHLMNASFWSHKVAPPNKIMTDRLMMCMASIERRRSLSQTNC